MKQEDNFIPRPPWLDDELEVITVLNYFLDKLDQQPASERVRMPRFRLTPKKLPKLFRHDEAADRSWAFIKSLDGLLYDIRLPRKRQPYDAEFVGASLVMLEAGEGLCREWLSRPVTTSYPQAWALALDEYENTFADNGISLRRQPIKITGQSATAVVAAFAEIAAYLNTTMTLRQLSARCFWGNSKVLDARQGLLNELFPTLQIAPRPVLVHIHLPETCTGVLFIENQDSYMQALKGQPEGVSNLAVIYSAGFRGSAERIRTRDGASLHYHGCYDEGIKKKLEAWWFDYHAPLGPVWFWGDLDYSGMAILKALRLRFEDVQAWPLGYDSLLQVLKNEGGHCAEMADKAGQDDPGETGCEYADGVLLAEIRLSGRFVDQEVI